MTGERADKFFDDFRVGERFLSETATITESEILEFARRFDPQPFHIDPEAAKESSYGGIIASGYHTLSLGFRLFYDTGAIAACGMGSPGIEEIRWPLPVRPGDALRTEAEVAAVRPSSKPGRGVMTMNFRVFNQRGETVLTMRAIMLLKRREGA